VVKHTGFSGHLASHYLVNRVCINFFASVDPRYNGI